MDQDQIEMPVQRCLYRQSSVETRLSPANLSEEELSDSDSADESSPKIVNILLKQSPDFLSELQNVQREQNLKGSADPKSARPNTSKHNMNDKITSDIYAVPNKSHLPIRPEVTNRPVSNRPSVPNRSDTPEKPRESNVSNNQMTNGPPKPLRSIIPVQDKKSRDESLDEEISKSIIQFVTVLTFGLAPKQVAGPAE